LRSACDQVHEFADGELPPDAADAFGQHLVDCPRCQRELEAIFALKALAETAAPAADPRPRRSGSQWGWLLVAGIIGVVGAVAALLSAR
jgi:anti-sigma factor RsiW